MSAFCQQLLSLAQLMMKVSTACKEISKTNRHGLLLLAHMYELTKQAAVPSLHKLLCSVFLTALQPYLK